MLKKGILLVNRIEENFRNQLLINSGVQRSCEVSNLNYLKNSFIPKKDWRPITDSEFKKLVTNNFSNPFHKTIAIGNIPKDIVSTIHKLELSNCKSLFDIDSTLRSKEKSITELNNKLEIFLGTKSSIPKFRFHRITKGQPNHETTTFHFINTEFVRYTGLHIDESRIFTPYSAYKSDNRISINISEESRYLFYVNLSLRQISNLIKNTEITASNIVEKFFEQNPNYPIIRLEIKPYQYYIAPTDNFIHDGSTLGNKKHDITIVYTGIFDKY